MREIVVNGLRHADDAHFIAALHGALVDFIGGVLGIVATGVKEVANVVGLQNLEHSLNIGVSALGLLLEVQLVSASAERGGGRVFQTLDGFGLLLVQIDQ